MEARGEICTGESGVVEVSDYDPLRIATALMRGSAPQPLRSAVS